MMVAVDNLSQWLAGNELARLGNDGKRSRVILRCLDQREVVCKLHQNAVMRPPGQVPHTLGELLDRDGRWRRSRDCRRLARIGWRRQVAGVAIHHVLS